MLEEVDSKQVDPPKHNLTAPKNVRVAFDVSGVGVIAVTVSLFATGIALLIVILNWNLPGFKEDVKDLNETTIPSINNQITSLKASYS